MLLLFISVLLSSQPDKFPALPPGDDVADSVVEPELEELALSGRGGGEDGLPIKGIDLSHNYYWTLERMPGSKQVILTYKRIKSYVLTSSLKDFEQRWRLLYHINVNL